MTGFHLHRSALSKLYRKHGIKRRKPNTVYLRAMRQQKKLDEERLAFAHKLGEILLAKASIIYVDETTVNSFMRLSRTYSYYDWPVSQTLNMSRLGGLTIYGGIGVCLRHAVFTIGKTTN